MAWCRQATIHYVSQCWPRSMSPYGVIRSQWVNRGWNKIIACDPTYQWNYHYQMTSFLLIYWKQFCLQILRSFLGLFWTSYINGTGFLKIIKSKKTPKHTQTTTTNNINNNNKQTRGVYSFLYWKYGQQWISPQSSSTLQETRPISYFPIISWWRHQMETFSALLAGNAELWCFHWSAPK